MSESKGVVDGFMCRFYSGIRAETLYSLNRKIQFLHMMKEDENKIQDGEHNGL